MAPANMKRYQLFLWESTEWFPQKTQWPVWKSNTVAEREKKEEELCTQHIQIFSS